MKLKILYVGALSGTCLQRAKALGDLGHEVRHLAAGGAYPFWQWQLHRISNRLKRPLDLHGANRAILTALEHEPFDVLWVDKGRTIRPQTLARARASAPRMILVAYSPDDMINPSNQSVRYLGCLPLFDAHVTTKSYNVAELKNLGARDVLFIDNAFDPALHRPIDLTEEERRQYAGEVGFVGGFERERAEIMLRMAENGVPVTVWGPGWRRFEKSHPNLILRGKYLDGLEFSKCINATRINLGFLRRANRDLQTTRSIEIPASGAFMLAERTDEHLSLFKEGLEAEFFDSFDELLEKSRHYLSHEDERARIAEAGRRRCLDGGYSNQDRLAGVLRWVDERFRG